MKKAFEAKERNFGTPISAEYSQRPERRRKKTKIIYPESDGKPMADNTKQFRWIVKIKENLERMFADNPDVFVAGDLLWYPVEGENKIRAAPDAMVVFGRPKGDRGSYRTWDENNIPPQVVFEILSPGNRKSEMDKKRRFYQRYGVMEYYVYDPDRNRLNGWTRSGKRFRAIEDEKMRTWISPLLKIRFDLSADDLRIFDSEGNEFLTPLESSLQYEEKLQKADKRVAEADKRVAEADKRAEAERQEKERLAAKLRELGINWR